MDQLDEDLKLPLSVEEFWENNHSGNMKGYKFWLTGSAGPDVWNYLNILNMIQPGTCVLNIGVGLGLCTRELARQKCVVHALDISPMALDKVRKIVTGCWQPHTIQEIPASTIDLAISNLVTQHMLNSDLAEQISGVLRSMKPAGIFAMQFACSLDTSYSSPDVIPLEVIKSGGVLRSLDFMTKIVQAAGGMVVWANRIGVFPQHGSGWYAIHIVRSDYPAISSVATSKLSFINKLRLHFRSLHE